MAGRALLLLFQCQWRIWHNQRDASNNCHMLSKSADIIDHIIRVWMDCEVQKVAEFVSVCYVAVGPAWRRLCHRRLNFHKPCPSCTLWRSTNLVLIDLALRTINNTSDKPSYNLYKISHISVISSCLNNHPRILSTLQGQWSGCHKSLMLLYSIFNNIVQNVAMGHSRTPVVSNAPAVAFASGSTTDDKRSNVVAINAVNNLIRTLNNTITTQFHDKLTVVSTTTGQLYQVPGLTSELGEYFAMNESRASIFLSLWQEERAAYAQKLYNQFCAPNLAAGPSV